MPAPASVAEYVEVLRKSGLVPEDRLAATLAGPKPPPTVDAAAQKLVEAGLLTRFQSKQTRAGRHKRFDVAGKYRLLELLGVGGMGAVYLCEHMFMKRLVAVKVLPVEKLQDPSALMRFYREARAVAALDHPNIVRAYDIDKVDQMHFLVMEYVDGASLQELVARHGPLDPLRAADYVAQSAHGLHHASHLGMVHRDIKPGNLLLERTGVIKILDMGLARFFDQTHDNVTEKFDNNCVLGTADYLAPEQAVSSVVDIRADIYALGGTLYFMLTGRSPFPDGTIAHKLVCHQREEPVPVTDFRADVPAELLAVLAKMMKKNPADRYQTPADLFDALAELAPAAPVPPPAREMPDLCPMVLSLSGHAADKARGGRSLLTTSRGPAGGDGSGVGAGMAARGAGSGTALGLLTPTGSSGRITPAPIASPSTLNPRGPTARTKPIDRPPVPPAPPPARRTGVLVGLAVGIGMTAGVVAVGLVGWLLLH